MAGSTDSAGATPATGTADGDKKTEGATPPDSGATPNTSPADSSGDSQTAPAATDSPPSDSSPDTLGPEGMAALARERDARKAAEKELAKIRKDQEDARKAAMSDAERQEAELSELRTAQEEWEVERATLSLENQVNRLGAQMGVIDADALVKLIDWEDLEFEDGKPTNTEAVVKAVVEKRPWLIGKAGGQQQGNINPGAGQGEPPAINLTPAELEAAKEANISPERYQALKGVQTLAEWEATRRTGQGT